MTTNSPPPDANGASLLQRAEFRSGQVIFQENTPAMALYVINSGSVTVSKLIHSTPTCIETLGVGDVFGEAALFADALNTVTATATTACSCLMVQAFQLNDLVRQSPDVAFRFVRKMAVRLMHGQYRLANFALRNPLARLMHQLKAEDARAPDNAAVALPFDLPEVLSMERSAVDHYMRTLINEGHVALGENGTFTITDRIAFGRYLTYLELNDRFERVENK